MLLSVFTPTHNPTYLKQAYDSICRQSYPNWEWVIVPNGKEAVVPDFIRQDKRVKVYSGAEQLYNIGAIKRFACDRCEGDAFIELDHDDMLMPGNTLTKIADLIRDGAGFVYSDVALFKHDVFPHEFSAAHGWESYDVDVYGHSMKASRCFPLSARSLCEIYYAPDHVRCWSRHAYYYSGGHNKFLPVGDDHELMIKTYLGGHKFAHTGGCNYLYRVHAANTVNVRNKKIQQHVAANRKQYTERLMREECSRKGWEIATWRWPLEPQFHTTKLGMVIIPEPNKINPREITPLFNRAWQYLEPGGYVVVGPFPTTDGRAAWMDPTDRSQLNGATFLRYCHKGLADAQAEIKCRFQNIQVYNEFPSDFHESHNLAYCTVHLAALKGQRQPGLQMI